MKFTSFQKAGQFLQKAQDYLEKSEAANSLILGICQGLIENPERIHYLPYLALLEEGGQPAAVAVRTPPQKLVIYSHLSPQDLDWSLLIQNLIEQQQTLPGVTGQAPLVETFAAAWDTAKGLSHKVGLRLRVYELTRVIPPSYSPGRLRLAVPSDMEFISSWVNAFQIEALGEGSLDQAHETARTRIQDGDIFIWEIRKPVSMAAKARPTRHGVTVNEVYTPPEYRGKGYASSCVASLSQYLLNSGSKFCTLFTDLSNPTSNSIYQKIGYQPVCDFNEAIFYHKIPTDG
ncbi:MAG: GNAT family N-acetyltransferase [Anaerolineaceae bacterium]|nr:GNAT family N-acetyltransferase [Anaerolineaceae bacterium]